MGTPYNARQRARFLGLEGPVNLPYGTSLVEEDGILRWKGMQVCAAGSQHALDYFVPDRDGKGRERGELVNAIIARLAKRDGGYQERWDKVWNDPLCGQYRRGEHEDHWLWSESFYAAAVEDLRYIARLVGAGKRGTEYETQ